MAAQAAQAVTRVRTSVIAPVPVLDNAEAGAGEVYSAQARAKGEVLTSDPVPVSTSAPAPLVADDAQTSEPDANLSQSGDAPPLPETAASANALGLNSVLELALSTQAPGASDQEPSSKRAKRHKETLFCSV